MLDSARAPDVSTRKARAERVLDEAAKLLLRLGYKRVTVEDVAEQAEIGKGTIYLHWKTREELFYAVFERDYLEAIDELVIVLRRDPQSVLLHRMTHALFLHFMRRPLLRAALTGDLELLGRMAKVVDRRAMEVQGRIVFNEYLQLLYREGLVRADIDPREFFFAYRATVGGYFIQKESFSDQDQIPLERRAELLATTIQRTFEVEEAPVSDAVLEIAPRVIEIFAEISTIVRAHLAQAYA
ncbi:MAG: TetR/AcrR family transcriptional regulator [Candidatus Dormibacteraceae bacterium]